MTDQSAVSKTPVVERLREATGDMHRRLDERMDAVGRLADPRKRQDLIRRYAAFHLPADALFRNRLDHIGGLQLEKRSRERHLARFAQGGGLPAFPQPECEASALGMLYVTEGSALGGRLILRELRERGVEDAELSFLDPYGSETGEMWRGLLAVLDRSVGSDPGRAARAADGARHAFRHAELVFCDGNA